MNSEQQKPGPKAYIVLIGLVVLIVSWFFLLWQAAALYNTATERREIMNEQRDTIRTLQVELRNCRGTFQY